MPLDLEIVFVVVRVGQRLHTVTELDHDELGLRGHVTAADVERSSQ